MRILVIHEYNLPYGGGEQYLHDTCEALRELGHRVALVCAAEWNGGFIPCDQAYGLTRSIGLRSGLRVWREYAAVVAREDPDVIFINGVLRHFVSPLILQRLVKSRPSVLFVHHSGVICHTATKVLPRSGRRCEWPMGMRCFTEGCVGTLTGSRVERWKTAAYGMSRLRVLRGCRHVIVPSQYIYRELVRNGFVPERVTVLPCFTEREWVSEPRAPERQILWVGRADAGKGLERFLRSLSMLKDLDWQAAVVGEATDSPRVQTIIEELGISDRVRCLGCLESDALDKEYAACRIVVFTSMWAETFGQVGIEAMAFGKPVVAFDVGGVREWLTEGVTGFVVARNDIASLAKRLARLLVDDALYERMGAAGQAAVERRFRRQHHVPKLLEVFNEAIGDGGRAAPGPAPAGAA